MRIWQKPRSRWGAVFAFRPAWLRDPVLYSDCSVGHGDMVFVDQDDRRIDAFDPDDEQAHAPFACAADGVRERGAFSLGAMDRNAELSLARAVRIDIDTAANPIVVD